MLFEVNKPGERCPRTALYRVYDKKFRLTGYYEFVERGRRFPDPPGTGDTYWPYLDL